MCAMSWKSLKVAAFSQLERQQEAELSKCIVFGP